jgi:hypothetical protein
MPGHSRVGLDENESVGPVIPYPANDNPEQPIESIQLGARSLPFVNGKLMAKSGRLHCRLCRALRNARTYVSMANRNVTITLMLLSSRFTRFGGIPKLFIGRGDRV